MKTFSQINTNIAACTKCDLKQYLINKDVVKNGGKLNADLVFIGIAPSYYNHTEFVFEEENYPTNKIFQEGLKSIGLKREDVYVTNLVKCSTLKNAKPTEEQILCCKQHLLKELFWVKPKLIIAMGAVVAKRFDTKVGQFSTYIGYDVYSIHHPARCCRDPSITSSFMKQFSEIQKFLKSLKKGTLFDLFVFFVLIRPPRIILLPSFTVTTDES